MYFAKSICEKSWLSSRYLIAAVHLPNEEHEKEETAIRKHTERKIPKESEASQTRFRVCIRVCIVVPGLHFAFTLDGLRNVGLNFSNFNFRLFLSELLGYSFACTIKQRPRNCGSTNLVSTWYGYHGGCLLDRQASAWRRRPWSNSHLFRSHRIISYLVTSI